MELDKTPRYAPDRVLVSGPDGFYDSPVTGSVFHPPGTHPQSPIRNDWAALELKTIHGSRWYGCESAYINSELRMVVVGTPPHDEVRMKWKVVPENKRR